MALVAAQLGIIATGLLAACVGYMAIFTSSTVVSPPRPCAPIPSALILSHSSMRSSSSLVLRTARLAARTCRSSSISTSLAISMALSAVPPMPDAQHARRAPAGAHGRHGLHHPVEHAVAGVEHDELALVLAAAALGRHLHVHGVARAPPLMCTTAGVLSLVFLRSNCGSATTEARSTLSGFSCRPAAHAFVDGILDRRRRSPRSARPCRSSGTR